MPVIINEIEVLGPPPVAPQQPAGAPPPAPAALLSDAVIRLVRSAADRQRRLVAD